LSQNLAFSSLGMGSYLGAEDEAADSLYQAAATKCLLSGVNVLDAAINYRAQRSERCFGAVLKKMIDAGTLKREEVIVCTKGGFLTFDGAQPADPRKYFQEKYIDSGLLDGKEIAQGCHAMTPKFLEDQLNQSLKNLGLETIDIYYIHNPETQLAALDRLEFRERMRAVFKWMEEKAAEGKIRMYGTATWNGYRVAPSEKDYLSLEDLNLLAREEGGKDHNFKVIQLPFNFSMPEGWIFPNQKFGKQDQSAFQVAARLGMTVMASASLLQSRLTALLPDFLNGQFGSLEKPAQCCIQFVRSVPGVTTALVGMKTGAHVDENLETLKVESLSEERLVGLFQNALN